VNFTHSELIRTEEARQKAMDLEKTRRNIATYGFEIPPKICKGKRKEKKPVIRCMK